jgi:uncharacterized membrane protein YphA (DoxX/SURF4 family)
MTKLSLGRHVFGLAAILFACVNFYWCQFNVWEQIQPLGNISHPTTLLFIAAAIQLFGGITIQFPKTARIGALALGSIYLIFALLWLPRIAHEPLLYDRWGNFFEQFSLVSGALIVFASFSSNDAPRSNKLARLGYFFFALCVVSFMLEQLFYLQGTASFVPKWIPPSQMFWAILTTVAFALAALALFTGRSVLLASRSLTLMILGFGLLVWLPRPFLDPHQLINWAGNAQNTAILGAAWIVTDYLTQSQSHQLV